MERKDCSDFFKKALKEYNIPFDGSLISWEGETGYEEIPGWGDRPDDYYQYDTSGHNQKVMYDEYFDDYLEDLNLTLDDIKNSADFEKYLLDWAYNNISIGFEGLTFGDLVEENQGDTDFWYIPGAPKYPYNENNNNKINSDSKKLKEENDEDYIGFMEKELSEFKKLWIRNPYITNHKNIPREIWNAEDKLRSIADYPTTREANSNVESWDNEDTGAAVYGDAYVEMDFTDYLLENNIPVQDISEKELARYFFDWGSNNCYLILTGDLWGFDGKLINFYGEEAGVISWDEYMDGYYPEWIDEED